MTTYFWLYNCTFVNPCNVKVLYHPFWYEKKKKMVTETKQKNLRKKMCISVYILTSLIVTYELLYIVNCNIKFFCFEKPFLYSVVLVQRFATLGFIFNLSLLNLRHRSPTDWTRYVRFSGVFWVILKVCLCFFFVFAFFLKIFLYECFTSWNASCVRMLAGVGEINLTNFAPRYYPWLFSQG